MEEVWSTVHNTGCELTANKDHEHQHEHGKVFSTRLLSCCTDEYAHTYDVSTYSVQQ